MGLRINEYFYEDEFACRCCGKVKMDRVFVERLGFAREHAGIPFVINSGYRCPDHNKAIGSMSDNHTEGKAADIACTNSGDRLIMVRALLRHFKRVGIHKAFIHVDSMPKPDALWLY